MTRRRKHRSAHPGPAAPSQPEIGLVSIPLLCCLLGAALFVYEFGGNKPTLTNEFLALEEAVAASAYTAYQLDEREQSAAEKLRRLQNAARLAALQDEVTALLEQHARLEAQQQDLDRLEKLLAEIEAAQIQLTDLQRQRDQSRAATTSLFGGYNGQYVLIECLAGEIIVHPQQRRIPLRDFYAHRDWLLGEIDRLGYVAIAVRPQAWTQDSFAEIKPLVQTHLAARRAAGQTIAHTDFPLKNDAPITPYLPPHL
ncbi:hypothetical protein [Actomonas aquatica]|uniref:DUF3450 domain-containing protein n=1 Tax=Actomonas aquatica TaxID=2866162 RepID=A0ABZ1C5Y4_9BACT|nr:hypothetical protein [Opitutus sp. WL0086]WRQ87146.1 hypothetical protein K1X11_020225 [Opitutus sp. WL0086]